MDYGKLYDVHVADTYDEDTLGLLSGVRNLAIAQIAASQLPESATLLDLGVGTGQTLAALAARFPTGRMIGVDLSPRMMEAAQRKLVLEAHVGDACEADKFTLAASVDLVIAHFLTTFVDRPRLFGVAASRLRLNGLFSVVSTTSEAFGRIRAGVAQLLGESGIIDRTSPSPETGDALAAELRASGFEIHRLETFRKPIVFENFNQALQWGLKSGFFAHIVEAIGMERIAMLEAMTQGMFPFHDEYVGVAVLAAPVSR
jgi:SAM-dependent methyltransferase